MERDKTKGGFYPKGTGLLLGFKERENGEIKHGEEREI